jgi:hypothetical protein
MNSVAKINGVTQVSGLTANNLSRNIYSWRCWF